MKTISGCVTMTVQCSLFVFVYLCVDYSDTCPDGEHCH